MDNLEKNIEIAIENDLFSQDENSNENKIFDTYGNYYFPTDFSNTEENSILSILLVKVPTISK
ncbi:MAG: hypothetical protein PHY83_04705 [Bacilli bacterium]|jgi:hypothetical protein|nr:hypothetical protein [Bacilli bacterium]MDD2682012.1 hypothetical protein [Bacilli bacterium]